MKLFKPSVLQHSLRVAAIQPKKSLSQNFLIDRNILKKMVSAAHPSPGDMFLEIGPGFGALTEALLDSGAEVCAIETDRRFARHLQSLQNGNLHIIEADVRSIHLDIFLNTLLQQRRHRHIKLLANIPYHLTGWVLQKFLPKAHAIETLHLMTQREIAMRCVASVGSKNYSSLTLFTRYYSCPHLLYRVSPPCFYPKSRVDSAILQLRLHPPPLAGPLEKLFLHIIRTAFQKRRKMLRTSLREVASSATIEEILLSIKVVPTARPQHLTLQHFIDLTKSLFPICSSESFEFKSLT